MKKVLLLAAVALSASVHAENVFYPVSPCRALDTRSGAAVVSGSTTTVTIGGVCGVPSTAQAVVATLTAVTPTHNGHLTVFATGDPRPTTSLVNFNAGWVAIANTAAIPLSLGGEMSIYSHVGAAGTVHLVVDVSGYYAPEPQG